MEEKLDLILECGSTKSDWRIIKNNQVIHSIQTPGFNPNYHSKERIIDILLKHLEGFYPLSSDAHIYFYGSGVSDTKRKNIIYEALHAVFKITNIEINHDLLAAARATCQNKPGIAVILGTGSNTVLYDGKNQVDTIANLGYILGDEGSGNQLGRQLLRAYFYRELPEELSVPFSRLIPGGRSELLDQLYGPGAAPATFMGSFTKFYTAYPDHPFLQNLLSICFERLVEHHLLKYDNHQILPIHFVGSIAHYFKKELSAVLNRYRLNMGKVIQKPIDGLVKYHLTNEVI